MNSMMNRGFVAEARREAVQYSKVVESCTSLSERRGSAIQSRKTLIYIGTLNQPQRRAVIHTMGVRFQIERFFEKSRGKLILLQLLCSQLIITTENHVH